MPPPHPVRLWQLVLNKVIKAFPRICLHSKQCSTCCGWREILWHNLNTPALLHASTLNCFCNIVFIRSGVLYFCLLIPLLHSQAVLCWLSRMFGVCLPRNIDKLRAVRTLWQEILQKSQCSIVKVSNYITIL